MKTAVVLAASALLALAGCSGGSDSGTSQTSPSPSASASDPAIIGPVIVEPDQTDVQATVGRTIVFRVGANPGRWDITTDNDQVLRVQRGGKDGEAIFNPGAEALAAGTATVTLTDTKSKLDALEYTVTVTE